MTKNKILNKKPFLLIQLLKMLIITGCVSDTSIKQTFIRNDKAFLSKFEHPHIDFSNDKDLSDYFSKEKLKTNEGREKLTQNILAFLELRQGLSQDQIIVPPETTIRILVSSFCASHNKAAPDEDEVYQWIKGSPKVTLLRPVIDYFNKSKKEKDTIQELIWNLSNNVRYEDYPLKLRRIINDISPSAKMILPSNAKDKIKNFVLDNIFPYQVKDTLQILNGKYHSFGDFKSFIDNIQSKENMPSSNTFSKIPGTNLITTIKSNNYTSQVMTIYNPTKKYETISISDYYLKPMRNDVQPIVLTSVMPDLEELSDILDGLVWTAIGYMGSLYPTLTDAEKKLIKKYPKEAWIVWSLARIAEKEEDIRFPQSKKNGSGDAFRHFVWAGLLARDIHEDLAREFLTAHENDPRLPIIEINMDKFNNESGITTAKTILKQKGYFDNQELFDVAQEMIDKDQLYVLNK